MKVSPPPPAGCAAAAATLSAEVLQLSVGSQESPKGGAAAVFLQGRRFTAWLSVRTGLVLAARQTADLSAALQALQFWYHVI